MKKSFILLLIQIVILISCESNNSSGIQVFNTSNPTAEEVISLNSDSNIFMHEGIIYMAGVSWVDEVELTKDQYITEIVEQSDDGKDFVNGTANKLTVGTKIFKAKERGDIVIAETEDGDIRFLKLVEG